MKRLSTHPSDEPVVRRVRAEFSEMPCLRLTSRQAQRLFGLGELLCSRVLQNLVETGFLAQRADGTYVRVSADRVYLPSPVPAAAGDLARTA